VIRQGGGEKAEEATSPEADATRDGEPDHDTDAETQTEGLTGRVGCKGETGIAPPFEGIGRCSGNERHNEG
jgi:hypothetical protein